MRRAARPWVWMCGLLTLAALTTGCGLLSDQPEDDGGDDGTLFPPGDDVHDSLNNAPPVADAGADQEVTPGAAVVLDGTGSADEDGDGLIFYWRQVSGSPTVLLQGTFSALPRFDAPAAVTAPTTLIFRLEVSDGFAFDAAEVTVIVHP